MNKNILPIDAAGHLDTDRKIRIDQERIHLIYKQSPSGIAATVVIAAVLIFLLRDTVPAGVLTGWSVAIALVSGLRFLVVLKYPRTDTVYEHALAWSRWNNYTLAFSGIVWGASAWMLFPVDSVMHQFFLAVSLCGMVAGSAMAFAVIEKSFFCYSIPALSPLFLRLITLPGEIYLSMGIFVLLFWGLSYWIVVNYKQARMNLLELKQDLSDRVAERTMNLEKLNNRLRAENRHRHRMEERLRRERDRLETITGNLGAGIAVISKDYKITWSNKVLKNIFGHVESRSCFETIYQNIDRSNCNAVKVFEENSEKATWEQETRYGQNKPVWYQMIGTPIRDKDGRTTAALELILPITELKIAQEEKQRMAAQLQEAHKLEAVATLAGGMAHKFNNALAVIMGNVELMRYGNNLQNDGERLLNPIMCAANQMSQMTDQLLAYAKGGKYKVRPTEISTFIEETVAVFKHSLPLKINIATFLETPPTYVKMDLTQMQMAMTALLSNAVEALPQSGNIRLKCCNQIISTLDNRLTGNLKPGPYVIITVADDGVGMDDITRQRIFEPFFSTKFEGRGLGMAAVYGIIQNHGGHITIASRPNQGTEVTLFLPATEDQEPEPAAPPAELPVSKGHFTVLLVEDDAQVRTVNEALLKRLGYGVLTAVDGREANHKIGDPDLFFDVILLDVKLPDMDGLAIFPYAKSRRPDAKVIVCSGYALDGPTQALMDVGADGFLQKPFSAEKLAAKIDEVLAKPNDGYVPF